MLLNTVKFYYKGIDSASYVITNSANQMINLNDSKLFSYEISDGAYLVNPKEFDLTFTCKTKTIANNIVENLMLDRTNGTELGTLFVDDWYLDCTCTGITAIDADEYNVVQFTAHFYAKKGFLWYQVVDSTVTIGSAGTGTYQFPAFAGLRTWRVKAQVATDGTGTINIGLSSSVTTIAYNAWDSLPNAYLLLDGHNKQFKSCSSSSYSVGSATPDVVTYLTDYYNMFFKYLTTASGSTSNFGIHITGAVASSTMYVREYRYRGMPTW